MSWPRTVVETRGKEAVFLPARRARAAQTLRSHHSDAFVSDTAGRERYAFGTVETQRKAEKETSAENGHSARFKAEAETAVPRAHR